LRVLISAIQAANWRLGRHSTEAAAMTQANYSNEAVLPANAAREILDVAAIRNKFRSGGLPLTQQAFADGLGIPVKTLRHWEQGKR
jgi:DNA-binding transcriptional regulator YiaG